MCILSYDVVTEKTPVTYGTCHLRDKMKKPISSVINLYNTVKSIENHRLEYKEVFLQSFYQFPEQNYAEKLFVTIKPEVCL